MYTKQALHELAIDSVALTAAQRQALDADGFYIVEDVITAAECRAMADAFEPPPEGGGPLRHPKRDHQGWWN